MIATQTLLGVLFLKWTCIVFTPFQPAAEQSSALPTWREGSPPHRAGGQTPRRSLLGETRVEQTRHLSGYGHLTTAFAPPPLQRQTRRSHVATPSGACARS